jgi:tetratricopeptide (TPR) repeat protein
MGASAMQQGKLDLSQSYLVRAVKLDPGNAEAHEQLGFNFAKRQDWSSALVEMKQAVKIEPQNSLYRYNLGLLNFKRQAYPDARLEFLRALDLQNENPDYRFAYASVLEEEGTIEQAKEEFGWLVERYPRMSSAQYSLAEILYKGGDLEGAEGHVEEVLRLEPDDADAYYLLAQIQEHKSRLAEAVQSGLQVIRLKPTHLNGHYLLSLLYARLRQPEEARQESAAFESLKSKIDSANFVILGSSFLRGGQLDLAQQNFAAAVSKDPQNFQALYQLALTLQQKREYTQAFEAYQKALSLNPRTAIAHAEIGLLLVEMGRVAEARSHLERAIELDPDDFGVTLATGRAFLLLRDYSRGEASLLRALQLFPSQPTVLVNLFQLYQMWGKTIPARRYAKLAVNANPQDERLLVRAGKFWLEQRDFAQARQDLERGVALDPSDSTSYLNLAWVYFYIREYTLARGALNRYLQLSQHSGESRCLSAKLLLQSGDLGGALEEARQASQLSPDDPHIFLLLSQIYDRLHRKEEANAALQRYEEMATPHF